MAWYRAGTATFTNGSKNVTGSGTAWVLNVRPGDEIIGPDNISREVEAVTADGALSMVEAYSGTTAPGAAYKVKPIQGWNRDVAAQLAALINDYGSIEAVLVVLGGNVGIGKTPTVHLDVAGQVVASMPDGANAITAIGATVGGAIALCPDGANGNAIRWAGSGASANVLRFLATGDVERARFDNAGNFGIGNAPSHKLDVLGAQDAPLSIRIANGSTGSSASARLIFDSQGGTWAIEGRRVDGALAMSSSGAERMQIDAAGNTRIRLQSVAPTLNDAGEFNITRISDSVIRFCMRGSDGVTRYGDFNLSAI